MMYDLFDITTMNLMDWFDSLDEALTAVRETITAHGAEAIETWVLVPENTELPPIRSDELLRRAQTDVEQQTRVR